MKNFELIDDYLTNRLNELDQKSFEQQMTSDPALKADVEFQRMIIQSLKAARTAELKSMLSKVPVGTPTFYFSPLRIAAGLIGTAVLATGLYFYYDTSNDLNPNQISTSLVDSIRQTEQNNTEIKIDDILKESKTDASVDKKSNNKEVKIDDINDKQIDANVQEKNPAIDLLDPTDELAENKISPEKTSEGNSTISVAKIEVTVNSSERKLKSHYQFVKGKLVLYGNFDNGLYEIIEVHALNSHSLFLYYKTSYYLLDDTKSEVTLLKEISDPVLIQKLKAFRSTSN